MSCVNSFFKNVAMLHACHCPLTSNLIAMTIHITPRTKALLRPKRKCSLYLSRQRLKPENRASPTQGHEDAPISAYPLNQSGEFKLAAASQSCTINKCSADKRAGCREDGIETDGADSNSSANDKCATVQMSVRDVFQF